MMDQIAFHEPSLNLSYRVDFREAFQQLAPVEGPITREMILRLEDAMRELPPAEAPVTHYFANGMYAREMFLSKGKIATGKIHKEEHLFIVSQGDVTILTENGMERIRAPRTLVGRPGLKRAAYAHADTVCIAIHRTPETDLAKIEAQCVAQDFDEYDRHLRALEVKP